MDKCPECGKVHPEDKMIAEAGLTWDQIEEFKGRTDWPLASKLAGLLIDIGNECSHQYDRADFYVRQATQGEAP